MVAGGLRVSSESACADEGLSGSDSPISKVRVFVAPLRTAIVIRLRRITYTVLSLLLFSFSINGT